MVFWSLFSKVFDPPEAAGPNRASDSGRGGGSEAFGAAEGVVLDSEEVVIG